jgi:hypothetical protein
MALYSIARGGNKRNFPMLGDHMYSTANTYGDIKYDGALPRRHLQLYTHFDGGTADIRNFVRMETPGNKFLPNDMINFAWINEGTEVHKWVVNVKGNVAGVTGKFQLYDEAGVTVGAAMNVDFAVKGYTGLGGADKNIAMPTNGTLRFTLLTGALDAVCFDIVTSLTSYKLEDTCSCNPPPCDVPTPEPVCFSTQRGA